MLLLTIESSCDETAACVYSDTNGVLSNVVFSQIDLHKQYGGVVPELASRSHLQNIGLVVQQALDGAGCRLESLDAIGVVNEPGLPGALLVGVCFAKALALCAGKPLIAINHIQAHIFSSFLEYDVPFPHVCLLASGGNTALYLVHSFDDYRILGTTRDDAAGEAFDKTAKIIGLGYPGGPVIEKLASSINFYDDKRYPRAKNKTADFSFSGLKTAVLYDVVNRGFYDLRARRLIKEIPPEEKAQIASSLLNCVADVFADKLSLVYEAHPEIRAVTFVGGVACNKFLRERVATWANSQGISFFVPKPSYCTDNAAMSAIVAAHKLRNGSFAQEDFDIAY